MNIKFKNGTSFEYLNALETEEYFNGTNRRTLTFECSPGVVKIDELNAMISDEANTSCIELSNGDVTNIYDGYVLKLKCGIENKLVRAETPDTPAVYEDRLIFKLGKRTYLEQMLLNRDNRDYKDFLI